MKMRGSVHTNTLKYSRSCVVLVEIQMHFIVGSHFQYSQNKKKKLIATLMCNYALIYRPNSHNSQKSPSVQCWRTLFSTYWITAPREITQTDISYRLLSEILNTTHAGGVHFILQVRKGEWKCPGICQRPLSHHCWVRHSSPAPPNVPSHSDPSLQSRLCRSWRKLNTASLALVQIWGYL